MDKLTVTLKLPTGMKTWLAAEGDPLYRTATEQAAYLCSEYLKAVFKRAHATAKHSHPAVHGRFMGTEAE